MVSSSSNVEWKTNKKDPLTHQFSINLNLKTRKFNQDKWKRVNDDDRQFVYTKFSSGTRRKEILKYRKKKSCENFVNKRQDAKKLSPLTISLKNDNLIIILIFYSQKKIWGYYKNFISILQSFSFQSKCWCFFLLWFLSIIIEKCNSNEIETYKIPW